MGWVQRLRERIDPPREVLSHEWVVLTTVPFAEGPLVHSALIGAGIEAVMQETRPLPSHVPDVHRIIVRQGDLPLAQEILQDLRAP